MSFPESSSVDTTSVSPDAMATAAELRVCQAVQQKSVAQEVSEHERRQKFRRMIDPGIMRPNAHDQALRSLKVYLSPENYHYTYFPIDTSNNLREPDP
jgi:phosphatidylserine decarboxylase